MAEQSMVWTTNDTGHGPAAGYSAERWQEFLKMLLTPGADKQQVYGVIANEAEELECTAASANTIDVNTGSAIVCGFFYQLTADTQLTVTSPASTTGGHVILEVDWTAQTVTVEAVKNTVGNTDPPALTQTEGTTWQIRLYTFTITAAGVITLSDVREYINPPQSLVYNRQGGASDTWRTSGTTEYVNQTGIMQLGSIEWTGTAAASGSIDVTFSKAFSNVPLVFVNCIDDTDPSNIICNAKPWYSTYPGEKLTISWETADAGTRTSILFSWMAIGPE